MSPAAGPPMHRPMPVLATLGFALNGAWMFLLPDHWFATIPGVAATGAFNPHLVRDIGGIYLAIGLAVGLMWARPRLARGAMTIASAWLLLHALVHVMDLFRGASPVWATEILGVYAPAALAVALTRRTEP